MSQLNPWSGKRKILQVSAVQRRQKKGFKILRNKKMFILREFWKMREINRAPTVDNLI